MDRHSSEAGQVYLRHLKKDFEHLLHNPNHLTMIRVFYQPDIDFFTISAIVFVFAKPEFARG